MPGPVDAKRSNALANRLVPSDCNYLRSQFHAQLTYSFTTAFSTPIVNIDAVLN